jgi:hypothetical protein
MTGPDITPEAYLKTAFGQNWISIDNPQDFQ